MIAFFFRLLVRLAVVLGLFAFGSYAVLDDPVETYRDMYVDARCRADPERLCDMTIRMTAPAVNVFFVDPALVTREGRQVAVLAEDWPYCRDATGEIYEIPRHFETDFASIPGWAQFYIDPSERSIVGAAIVHDWLYAFGGPQPDEAKRLADDLFRIELGGADVNVIKRHIMYYAVSLFGGRTFGSDDEMRFRDPRTGDAYTQPRPESLVVGQVDPGCDRFLEEYWDDRPGFIPPNNDLAPVFIQDWIDLSG